MIFTCISHTDARSRYGPVTKGWIIRFKKM